MTDVALKEYLERLIHETDRRYEQRFNAADLALGKAETALAEYKRGSNEWRDALKDQSQRLATREELSRVDLAVQKLQQDRANLDGRLMVISASVSVFVSALVILMIYWLTGR